MDPARLKYCTAKKPPKRLSHKFVGRRTVFLGRNHHSIYNVYAVSSFFGQINLNEDSDPGMRAYFRKKI